MRAHSHGKPTRRSVQRSGGGFLEVYETPSGDLPVLHCFGDAEDMGRQYGALAGPLVKANSERLLSLFAGMGLPDAAVRLILDRAWALMEPHVPERFAREMAAVAGGAREAGVQVAVEDLQRIVAVTNLDLYRREERLLELAGEELRALLGGAEPHTPASCTMFAVWGSRTVDGKMYAHRNLDWLSQTGLHEARMLTVYHPERGNAFVTMGYAGVTGALAGMNARGITLAEVGAFSVREELDGIPWVFLARRVLEESDSIEDAREILVSARHTIGYNYLVADGDPENFGAGGYRPRALAFETNFECCEVFQDNDPQEHAAAWTAPDGERKPYGLALPEALMRADTAFGERSRALQATDNGPGDPANDGDPFKPFFGNSYLECHRPMHDMISAYETGSAYTFPVRNTPVIEKGKPRPIGPEEALTIAATVAHNTEKLAENDWNVMSVVYAPTDLRFWVSYESCTEGAWKNAPDSGYAEFDLRELLDARP